MGEDMQYFAAHENWVHGYIRIHYLQCGIINTARRLEMEGGIVRQSSMWHDLGMHANREAARAQARVQRMRQDREYEYLYCHMCLYEL